MTNPDPAELGDVQRTLFFPLAARARETRKKRPLLRDPKAVELTQAISFDARVYDMGFASQMVVLRTMIFDWWVAQFLAAHPAGTVVELGTGLNTRFERADNGTVHWVDLDLPDTIALRRRYFSDTDRRRMIAASLLADDWFTAVAELPRPYFFVSDGVLPYLTEEQVTGALGRIAARFPGALIAFDTYPKAVFDGQQRMADKRPIARWQWACDDPRTLERHGLRLLESATVTRPPAGLRARLPVSYRFLLTLAHPVVGRGLALSLFRAQPLSQVQDQ